MRKRDLERRSHDRQELRDALRNRSREMWEASRRERVAVPHVHRKNQCPEKRGVLGQESACDIWLASEFLSGLVPAPCETEASEDYYAAEGSG